MRGTVIAKDGRVTGHPGFGRYMAGRAAALIDALNVEGVPLAGVVPDP